MNFFAAIWYDELQPLWLDSILLLRHLAGVVIANSSQMLVTALMVILLTGLIGGMIVRRFQQPLILGYIMSGVLVGVFFKAGFGTAANVALNSLADVGVALLLFAMGLEFSRRDLIPIRKIATWGTLAQVLFTLIASSLLAWHIDGMTGWFPTWTSRCIFGSAFVSTSTAVILKTLSAKGVKDALSGRVMIGMSIVQDLTVIPLVLLVSRLGDLSGGAGAALWQLSLGAVGMVLILLGGAFILPRLLKATARQEVGELYLLAALVIALVAGYFAELMKLSFSFGAFLAGIALSESPYGKKTLYELAPVRDLFAMLFFVSIGMMLDAGYLAEHFLLVTVLVAATALSRTAFLACVTWCGGYRNVIPLAMLFGMVPTSEMAFVVCRLALDAGDISHQAYSLILCVTVCSMIIGPVADGLTAPVYAFLRRTVWKSRQKNDIALPEPELSGHVVIAGGKAIGRIIAGVMRKWKRPYLLVEPEFRDFQMAQQEGMLVMYGDLRQEVIQVSAGMAHAAILLAVSESGEDNLAVMSSVRKRYPELHIVARAGTAAEAEDMIPLHLDEIVQPKFEAALELARQALLCMNTPAAAVQNSLDTIRRDHYRQSANTGKTIDVMRSFAGSMELYWAVIPEHSPAIGRSLAELDIRRQTGMSIVGILRNGAFESNPAAASLLQAHDTLAAIGDAESRSRLENFLKKKAAEEISAAVRQTPV